MKKAETKELEFKKESFKSHGKFLQNFASKLRENAATPLGVEIYDVKDLNNNPLTIREDMEEKTADAIRRALKFTEEPVFYHMYGQAGIEKRTLVKRIAKLLNQNLVIIDLKTLKDSSSEQWSNIFLNTVRENESEKTLLCLKNFHIFFEKGNENKEESFSIIEIAGNYFGTVFVLSDIKIDDSELEKRYFWFSENIPDLNSDENFKMWQKFMPEIKSMTDESPEEIASKFSFTPGQIEGTARFVRKAYLKNNEEKLSKEQFQKCAYSQVISTLGEKAKLITKKYKWNDIVIDEKTKLELQNACDRIKYKYKVYDSWGIGSKLLYGRGLSMIFHGRPGTGKTMAAQVIASELGMDLYKVDTARVVSKYIGETEKNLREIFEEARKSNVILLFDEADSLFSKRTDIKDSHDRNANLEVSFLLQQLEDHDGITILTTNKDQNIDEAFNRRITFKIYFPVYSHTIATSYGRESEDIKLRKTLWEKFLKNGKIPLHKDIDFDYLAGRFEVTGSDVRSVVTTAAFLACKDGSDRVNLKHILTAIKKLHKFSPHDFGYEHSTLVNEIFSR